MTNTMTKNNLRGRKGSFHFTLPVTAVTEGSQAQGDVTCLSRQEPGPETAEEHFLLAFFLALIQPLS